MNILMATDGSRDASNALDFLLHFPLPRDANITVMTVVDDIPLLPSELDALDEVQSEALSLAQKRLQEEADELVVAEGRRLREQGWPGITMVRNGDAVDEILQVAEEIDADLIVLGSHGVGMARRFLLGSVSGKVLDAANCSVLVVRKSISEKKRIDGGYRIMVAYDKSEVAEEALATCASLPLSADSEVTVVHVMPLVTAYRQDVRQHLNDIWVQKKQGIETDMDKAVSALQWSTPRVKNQLGEAADVSDGILSAAEQGGADLIMLGCKDKGRIKRLLLGSITRRTARHAECAVWVVRKKP